MTNKQALREAAEKAQALVDISRYESMTALTEFEEAVTPDVMLALLDEISELEQQHCGTALLEREEAHSKTVSRLLDELEKWRQESASWQAVAEKQLAVAIEAETRLSELAEELDIAKQAISDVEGEMACKLSAIDDDLCELLPGVQYMDPPEGGSVTPLEQVRRMVADYREQIAELESERDKQGRHACELFDEVNSQRQQIAELVAAGIITRIEG